MLQAEVHPKIVSERLGHAGVAITMDTYSHVLPGLQEGPQTVSPGCWQGLLKSNVVKMLPIGGNAPRQASQTALFQIRF